MSEIIPSPSMPTIKHDALDHSPVKWSSMRQWCYIHIDPPLLFRVLSPGEGRGREREGRKFSLHFLLSPASSMVCSSKHRFLLYWHNTSIQCIIALFRQQRNSMQTIAPSMWDREDYFDQLIQFPQASFRFSSASNVRQWTCLNKPKCLLMGSFNRKVNFSA